MNKKTVLLIILFIFNQKLYSQTIIDFFEMEFATIFQMENIEDGSLKINIEIDDSLELFFIFNQARNVSKLSLNKELSQNSIFNKYFIEKKIDSLKFFKNKYDYSRYSDEEYFCTHGSISIGIKENITIVKICIKKEEYIYLIFVFDEQKRELQLDNFFKTKKGVLEGHYYEFEDHTFSIYNFSNGLLNGNSEIYFTKDPVIKYVYNFTQGVLNKNKSQLPKDYHRRMRRNSLIIDLVSFKEKLKMIILSSTEFYKEFFGNKIKKKQRVKIMDDLFPLRLLQKK